MRSSMGLTEVEGRREGWSRVKRKVDNLNTVPVSFWPPSFSGRRDEVRRNC